MKAKMKSIIAILVIFITLGCKENKNHQEVEMNTPEEIKKEKAKTADIADQGFIDGMTGKAWHNYLQLKMALVNSDASAANTAAGNLAESFGNDREEIKMLAQQIANSNDLEEQRTLFYQFSEKAENLFKDALNKGTIYKQYCPMAFNNQGAYWLSDVSEIRNPYFGDKMLKCGSVTETISK